MDIDKQQLIERFLAAGDLEKAELADRELPDRIDPGQHLEVLQQLGLDAALLMTQSDNLEDQHRE